MTDINPNDVVWITQSVGLVIEEYNDKFAIKSVRKYKKDNQDVLSYDWIFIEEYDKETKKRKLSDKPRPASSYLGDRDSALKALKFFLMRLSGTQSPQANNRQNHNEELPF